jgi:hypothetical protein
MLSRWSLVLLATGLVALDACATVPNVAPGVVWVAEYNSSRFGPVSNAFARAGDCAAWRERYRGTECLRAQLGGAADRWLFPIGIAADEPVTHYAGSPQREICEAMTATLPHDGVQAAGACQPYKVTP